MNTNEEKHAHALAIAAALGATFTNQNGDTPSGAGDVTMPDGTRFYLSVGGWSGRDKVHVGTRYPSHDTRSSQNTQRSTATTTQRDFDRIDYNSPTFDGINLSLTKTPEQAAKDIRRRFLPEYSRLYAMAVDYCTKQAAYVDSWESNSAAAHTAARDVQGLSVGYVGGDYVTFNVTVAPEGIAKLAAFVRGLSA